MPWCKPLGLACSTTIATAPTTAPTWPPTGTTTTTLPNPQPPPHAHCQVADDVKVNYGVIVLRRAFQKWAARCAAGWQLATGGWAAGGGRGRCRALCRAWHWA